MGMREEDDDNYISTIISAHSHHQNLLIMMLMKLDKPSLQGVTVGCILYQGYVSTMYYLIKDNTIRMTGANQDPPNLQFQFLKS